MNIASTLPNATPSAAVDQRFLERIRSHFPTLQTGTVFLENAGGSQVPAVVADAVRSYMLSTYVQLGAGYSVSLACDETVRKAHDFVSTMLNAGDTGQVMLGPSTTQLLSMLALCYAGVLKPGDEIIVAETGHEANIGPWARLADRGITIKTWKVDPSSFTCPIDALDALISDRTRLITAVHVSNLLGEVIDLGPIVNRARAVGARVVIDGVAFAPHRAIDVQALDVDWYVYSTYKVYGPHMAALYGRHDAIDELESPNHFFISKDVGPYAFELGGPSHEGCAGLCALGSYLNTLSDVSAEASCSRETVKTAFNLMTQCELPLQTRLIDFLASRPDVRIIGPASSGPERVGTVSFVHANKTSASICHEAHKRNIGIRHGHMYAYRLCQALGLSLDDGVVRISFVHYNTMDEVDRVIQVLDQVL